MSDKSPSFGRYEALFEIARGGMARVYAARLRGEGGFERAVAIKHMSSELDDPTFVAMFLDEARIAAAIHSPHVVHTFDVGRASDGRPFLAMELVVGVSLGRILFELGRVDRSLPLPIAVAILRDAALGLHHAHEAVGPSGEPLGIVHRDVSPQNVLVDEHGRVRIADFGIARALERRATTIAGVRRGKTAYMSPEQARGSVVDRRSDLFSLGVVAWEAIAGAPFNGSSATPSLADTGKKIPAALAAVVRRALEPEPVGRHRTAHELALALEGSGVEPALEGDVAELVRELCGEELEALRNPSPLAGDRPAVRPRRVLAMVLGAGIAVAGTVLLVRGFGGDEPLPPHEEVAPPTTPAHSPEATTPAPPPPLARMDVAPTSEVVPDRDATRPTPHRARTRASRPEERVEPAAVESPAPPARGALPFGISDFPSGEEEPRP